MGTILALVTYLVALIAARNTDPTHPIMHFPSLSTTASALLASRFRIKSLGLVNCALRNLYLNRFAVQMKLQLNLLLACPINHLFQSTAHRKANKLSDPILQHVVELGLLHLLICSMLSNQQCPVPKPSGDIHHRVLSLSEIQKLSH